MPVTLCLMATCCSSLMPVTFCLLAVLLWFSDDCYHMFVDSSVIVL